jgi:hypothetical protein
MTSKQNEILKLKEILFLKKYWNIIKNIFNFFILF